MRLLHQLDVILPVPTVEFEEGAAFGGGSEKSRRADQVDIDRELVRQP
jgi:hypothetical protein